MQTLYDEDYFMRGIEKGVSNYVRYSWLEERTMAHARRLIDVMGILETDTVLDWGCARGYTVKALRRLGIKAWGYDISEWAIQNCDPEVKDFASNAFGHCPLTGGPYDHIIAKDLMEHLEPIDLIRAADTMLQMAQVSILAIVPLTERVGGQYVRKEDDMDVTHKIRWPLEDWMDFFRRRISGEEWVLTGSWHIPSLKPTSLSHPKSCGFIVMARNQESEASQ